MGRMRSAFPPDLTMTNIMGGALGLREQNLWCPYAHAFEFVSRYRNTQQWRPLPQALEVVWSYGENRMYVSAFPKGNSYDTI